MDGLVRQGRATSREVRLGQPVQVMTVWELDDGSVVRLKPLGDVHRPGPTLSGEIKLDPRRPDRAQDDIAFKLTASGRPAPKAMANAAPPFSKNDAQMRFADAALMDASHIKLGSR